MGIRSTLGGLALWLLASGCGSYSANGVGGAGNSTSNGGSGQGVGGGPAGLNASERQELQRLELELRTTEELDSAGLLAKHAVSEVTALSYDPRASQFMDRIQASALALTED